LGEPPPPHVSEPLQLPHWSVLPQPSLIAPQFLPWAVQVVGVQALPPHTFAVPPPPQVWPEPHVPHWRTELQPSLMVPQFLPWAAQVVGEQVPDPQTLAVPPPPQLCPEPQVPQLTVPLQPSGMVPQFWPVAQAVSGVQLPPASGVSRLADSTVPEQATHSRTAKQAIRVIVFRDVTSDPGATRCTSSPSPESR
jgi:hypothetical protein